LTEHYSFAIGTAPTLTLLHFGLGFCLSLHSTRIRGFDRNHLDGWANFTV